MNLECGEKLTGKPCKGMKLVASTQYNKQELVREFFKLAEQPWRDDCSEWPSKEMVDLTWESIIGEVMELRIALQNKDIVEVADAFADIMYFLYGGALRFGFSLDPIFMEVHRSNMTKKWPEGTPREVSHNHKGKLLKPPSYSLPNLKPLLQKEGFNG